MAAIAANIIYSGPTGISLKPGVKEGLLALYTDVAAAITVVNTVELAVEATAHILFTVPGSDVLVRVTHPDEMYALAGDDADRKWWIGLVDGETGEDLRSVMLDPSASAAQIAEAVADLTELVATV